MFKHHNSMVAKEGEPMPADFSNKERLRQTSYSESKSAAQEPEEKPVTTSLGNFSKTVCISVISVVLGVTIFSAIAYHYPGVIHLKLGFDGGELLIDGRTPLNSNR